MSISKGLLQARQFLGYKISRTQESSFLKDDEKEEKILDCMDKKNVRIK
ncbi:MAG: hypothetical protein JW774_07110 [Candidatus Aureabacteria bacterium]|nr:hypothetical protein [Candidatus Auribacterota bacterium]